MSKGKIKNKIVGFGRRFFSRFFGFEVGIDIANDTAVLHRRNIVIKNIVFVSNLVYTLMFLGLSLFSQRPEDWLITALALPITISINSMLKKLITGDPTNMTKQEVASYVSTFYIFISSILVYLRIYGGYQVSDTQNYIFETVGYVLIYYALVVISLYQDKVLLSSSFLSLLGVLTIIHFVFTYNVLGSEMTVNEFLNDFIKTKEFADILLRTVIFILFYFVIYAIVSIGQSIQEERKTELSKRRLVQSDFAHIVKNLFSVVFAASHNLLDATHAYKVASLSKEIAKVYHASDEIKTEIDNYVLIHLRFDEIKDLMLNNELYDEKTYDLLREKTQLGSKIARRLQLAQKAMEIMRVNIENVADEQFLNEMLKIQPNIEAQIILLAEIYASLRFISSYRRPYTHNQVLDFFKKVLTPYFDHSLKETFLKYHEEIDRLYQSLGSINQLS